MSKTSKAIVLFFLNTWLSVLGFSRAALKTPFIRYVLGPLAVLFFLITTWHFRMWLSILQLVFRDAAHYYVGVFWPALFSLLKGYFYMPLWLGLGDLLHKWRVALLYYFYYRPLQAHNEWRHWDKRWYWKDNPAMWMADLMWEDLVKFYEKLWFWYFYHLYTTKRRMENFADYPYTHMWWFIKFVWSRVSIYRFSGRFYKSLGRVLVRFRLRNSVLLEAFKLKLYLGLSGEEYRTGRIKGLLDYPKIFDFKKLKIVERDNYVVLPERWR